MSRILAINPGSTSTKIAVFDDEREIFRHEITYRGADFAGMDRITDQLPRREADIEAALAGTFGPGSFDAVVGRGGLVGPVGPGGYEVDDDFLDVITNRPVLEHASNLGGPLAKALVTKFGVPGAHAYIYDPVTVDEMSDAARITGVAGIERKSIGHHLNMRAVARKLADAIDSPYEEASEIIVHLGGGSTACAISSGRMVDFVSDDEIMFSAERSGGVPIKELIALAGSMQLAELKSAVRSGGGLAGLLGTTDLREIESRIGAGDERAALVFEALALGIAKTIAALAASLKGEVDAIALTGGMARSELLLAAVRERAGWIAPIHAFGGEFEMEALALGARRIVLGEERAHHVRDYLRTTHD